MRRGVFRVDLYQAPHIFSGLQTNSYSQGYSTYWGNARSAFETLREVKMVEGVHLYAPDAPGRRTSAGPNGFGVDGTDKGTDA